MTSLGYVWRWGQRNAFRGESKYSVLAMRAMVGISVAVMGRMKSISGDADDGLGKGLESMLCDENSQ